MWAMSTQQLWDAGMPQQWQHCEGQLPLCAAPNAAMEVVTLQEPLFSWTALFFLHFELLVTFYSFTSMVLLNFSHSCKQSPSKI